MHYHHTLEYKSLASTRKQVMKLDYNIRDWRYEEKRKKSMTRVENCVQGF